MPSSSPPPVPVSSVDVSQEKVHKPGTAATVLFTPDSYEANFVPSFIATKPAPSPNLRSAINVNWTHPTVSLGIQKSSTTTTRVYRSSPS